MTDKIEPVKNGHLTLPAETPFSLSIHKLRFQYEGRNHPALNGVNLEIAPVKRSLFSVRTAAEKQL